MLNDTIKTAEPGAAGFAPTADPAPASPPASPQTSHTDKPAPGAPPPAAHTVVHGALTEETWELRATLDEARRTIKARELRVSELEDENCRLKTPVPIPVKKKKPEQVIAFPWMRPLGSHSGGD